jgi:sRNA-binding carbon storage regulator CsrA
MESVVIGGSPGLAQVLKVTVLEVRDGRVRLGFEGDTDIAVNRLEVWEQIQASGKRNGSAAGTDSPVQ